VGSRVFDRLILKELAMKKIISLTAAVAVPAFLLAGALINPAMAQDKAAGPAPVTKTILENDKVKVYENIYKPGDVNTAIPASAIRIVHTINGGRLMRNYADGTTKAVELKTGATQYIEAGQAYTAKNVGKSTIRTYIVQLK
jgi:hypothetical protein